MHIPQTVKIYRSLSPQTVNAGTATVSENIDVAGASYVIVIFTAGTIGAADASALNLRTTNDGVAFETISGSAMTAPTSTSDNGTWTWLIDLKNIQVRRYIQVVFTMGAANATIQACAVVFYPNVGPVTATEMNVNRQLLIL